MQRFDQIVISSLGVCLLALRLPCIGRECDNPKIYVGGHRVGRNRILRLMRAHHLISQDRVASAAAKARDGRIVTDAPNVRWATDGAKVWTVDNGWLCLFTTIEHWNAECLGHHVCKRGDRFAAYEPVAKALAHVFGSSAAGGARGVASRHDHGSQYLTDYIQGRSRRELSHLRPRNARLEICPRRTAPRRQVRAVLRQTR